MQLGVIYKATCDITHKSYIGQTNNFSRRKKEHLSKKDGTVFHNAIQKYGPEHFSWDILEECPLSQLDEREKYWIAYFDTYEHGYNLTLGGDNANALNTWRKKHPDQVKQNALNGLKYAQEVHKNNPEALFNQLAEARKKAVQVVSKKVRCIELNLIFNSLAEAERWSETSDNPNGRKCSHQGISRVCSYKRHTCGGYRWEYV